MRNELIERARYFAIAAHAGQKYGREPYASHLADVEAELLLHGHTYPVLLAAAWLHDVLEDTEVDGDLLSQMFGYSVWSLVKAVTDLPGKNRRERHAATYPAIRRYGWMAVALKLADRLANVKAAQRTMTDSASKLAMYRREHPEFRRALYLGYELEDMWAELDKLLRT